MTNETGAAVAQLVTAAGYRTTWEYPGFISVRVERADGSGTNVAQVINFGDSSETIAGDLYDSVAAWLEGESPADSLDTGLESSSDDPQKIARAILAAIDEVEFQMEAEDYKNADRSA